MTDLSLAQERYDRVTIAFHWLTALLVLVLFGTAFAWNYLPRHGICARSRACMCRWASRWPRC